MWNNRKLGLLQTTYTVKGLQQLGFHPVVRTLPDVTTRPATTRTVTMTSNNTVPEVDFSMRLLQTTITVITSFINFKVTIW